MKSSFGTDYVSFLTRLRAGDLVTYGGTQWEVEDFSTYDDPNGYETMEWLLNSGKTSYYLLREGDPENLETRINWYLSEEIGVNRVSGEHVGDDVRFALWDAMQEHREPYFKLRALGRLYYFESQTEGIYTSENNSESRITWDYWDEKHLWNLAIEAWQNRELHVYSTKKVNPDDFVIAEKSITTQSFSSKYSPSHNKKSNDRTWEWICAWGLVIIGLIFIISGVIS